MANNKALLHPKHWLTWCFIGLLRLLALLPFSINMLLGKSLGYIAYMLMFTRKNIARKNISLCLPELSQHEQAKLVKANLINNGTGFIEAYYSWWAAPAEIKQITQINGLDLLQQYREQNRGVILLGAHFTPIEMAGRIMGEFSPLDVTYRPQNNPVLEYVVSQSRKDRHGELIKKNEMRKMVRNLKKGHVVWYTCDQDFGRKYSVFAPFFGIEAATIATLSRMLKMTDAKVLFMSYKREDTSGLSSPRYQVNITDPFNDALGKDDKQNAILINQTVERAVRENVEQYFWVHKRFKRRPHRSEPSFYK